MAATVLLRIDLTKIPKDKIYEGQKGKYADLALMINDETSQYGHNVSVSISQSKEERDNKDPKNYIGNGKVVWTDSKITLAEMPAASEETHYDQRENDLPF